MEWDGGKVHVCLFIPIHHSVIWRHWTLMKYMSKFILLLIIPSLVKDLKAARNVANKLLDSLENNKENKIEENKETNSPNLSQEDGK